MNFEELLTALCLNDKNIIVTLINPKRKGDWYKSGKLVGFKSGHTVCGRSNYENGMPHSLDNSRIMQWIKKPKVLVAYEYYSHGHRQDWINIDNCTFEIQTT